MFIFKSNWFIFWTSHCLCFFFIAQRGLSQHLFYRWNSTRIEERPQIYFKITIHFMFILPKPAQMYVALQAGSESVGHDPLNGSSCQTVWRRQCRGLWALPSFGVYFKDRECESGSKSLNGASSAAAASVSPLIHNTSSGPSPWCLPPPGECERLLFQCDILLRMYPLICIYSWHWNETRPTREGCFVLC